MEDFHKAVNRTRRYVISCGFRRKDVQGEEPQRCILGDLLTMNTATGDVSMPHLESIDRWMLSGRQGGITH